jgi:hypothetical protein
VLGQEVLNLQGTLSHKPLDLLGLQWGSSKEIQQPGCNRTAKDYTRLK